MKIMASAVKEKKDSCLSFHPTNSMLTKIIKPCNAVNIMVLLIVKW